jgi:hypothetical protein
MNSNHLKLSVPAILIFLFIAFNVSAQKGKRPKPERVLETGEVFNCDFEVIQTGIPNFFRIRASRNTDAAVRLIDKKTEKCVRYAFINAGDSYEIKGIPEGKYYVKVGLGKEWYFEDSTKCIGQFKQSAIYEKLNRTLDFNIKGSKHNQKIQSHELDLDVHTTEGKAEPSELINAQEFQR